jgi:thermitase
MRISRNLKTTFALLLIFFLGTILVKTTSARPAEQSSINNDYVKNEVLVKFKPGTPAPAKAGIHKLNHGYVKQEIKSIGVEVIGFKSGSVVAKVRAYNQNPNIEYAEPNYLAQAFVEVNDQYFNNQWGLNNTGQEYKSGLIGSVDADIDAPEAWDVVQGNEEVLIAILDSGIDQDHEDLADKIVDNRNFTGVGDVDDSYGHGTHVAGIAAAMTDNSMGVAGAGFSARLLNAKVLDSNGYGAYSWIAQAIEWAADQGVEVINMSLGGSRKSNTLEAAVNYAWENGVVLVAAAGNSGNSSPTYPGYYKQVIAVAATDSQDLKADFSSYGKWVDLAAPGVDVFSTFPNHQFTIQTLYGRSNDYDYGNGTSMAAPFVAGTAALVWSTGNYGTNLAVRQQLEKTADNISGTGSLWIYGRLNACRAVEGSCDQGPDPSPSPSPSLEPEPTEKPSPTPSDDLCGLCFKGECDGKCHPRELGTSCPDCFESGIRDNR